MPWRRDAKQGWLHRVYDSASARLYVCPDMMHGCMNSRGGQETTVRALLHRLASTWAKDRKVFCDEIPEGLQLSRKMALHVAGRGKSRMDAEKFANKAEQKATSQPRFPMTGGMAIKSRCCRGLKEASLPGLPSSTRSREPLASAWRRRTARNIAFQFQTTMDELTEGALWDFCTPPCP